MNAITGALYTLLTGRNWRWPQLRRAWLEDNPACEVCGTRLKCVPHHIEAVHVKPERELDPTNLVTLCPPHHLLFGHLGAWRSWNESVIADCVAWRDKIRFRPRKVKP